MSVKNNAVHQPIASIPPPRPQACRPGPSRVEILIFTDLERGSAGYREMAGLFVLEKMSTRGPWLEQFVIGVQWAFGLKRPGQLTGHPSQEHPSPQLQEPEEAHPHPPMMIVLSRS
jgi:hypothetical protein